jgi:hypothetical protein
MSAQARPISPTRFAAALKDLALSNLYNKVSELRNQLAHLDYSNQEMQAFAEGTAPGLTEPDKDCILAIEENEVVIKRIVERLALLRVEIEGRGNAWLDGRHEEERKLANGHLTEEQGRAVGDEPIMVGEGDEDGIGEMSEAWRDGTFTTGRIVNGEFVMDVQGGVVSEGATRTNGSTMDEGIHEPRRQSEERATEDEGVEDEGIHL